MMRLGIAVAIALSFCVVAPMASAQEHHWHTIAAVGDPNITIEIPSGVDQEGSDIARCVSGVAARALRESRNESANRPAREIDRRPDSGLKPL